MSIGTVFSEDGVYRYTLERTWVRYPINFCMFLMLNPSTATAIKNDNTISRCVNYAKAWGYDGLYVGNLYAFRATMPAHLWYHDHSGKDIVGPENDAWLRKMARKAKIVVGAWGEQAEPERVEEVIILLNLTKRTPIHCLGICKNGMPRHPLYLAKKLFPKPWGRRL
jgi:hypothetical protein